MALRHIKSTALTSTTIAVDQDNKKQCIKRWRGDYALWRPAGGSHAARGLLGLLRGGPKEAEAEVVVKPNNRSRRKKAEEEAKEEAAVKRWKQSEVAEEAIE